MKCMLKSALFALCIAVLVCSTARADDGYKLWMSYKKLDDAKTLEEYKQVFSSVVIEGQSETLGIVREEVKKGLDGLLGADVPVSDKLTTGSALVIGTPKQSQLIQKLGLSDKLAALGREGFLIKSIKIGNKPSIAIAANEDIGLLYGTFHLLRIMQTGQSLKDIDISSKPKIQYRLLDHWDKLDGTISDQRGYAGKSL
jgi:alpha-glucuronidase